MAEPFLSEIRIMSFGFPPEGWALCNGQLLPINQNRALFSLLGTTYGGDGRTTFALPNLQGRVPVHRGGGLTLGQAGGEQAHALSAGEMPQHTHALNGSAADASNPSPSNNVPAANTNLYGPGAQLVALQQPSVTIVGGSQAHQNMQPFLTLNFSIALQGIFPSPN